MGCAFAHFLFSALKPVSLLLKWKNNELTVYEAYYRFSIPNNLTKSGSTCIFLLTMFWAANPSTGFSFESFN